MPANRRNPDGSRQYQASEKRIRRRLKAAGGPCAICGGDIDYTLPQYHPECFEVDHIAPISYGGLKTFENSRPSHRRCNRARSNRLDADAIAALAEMGIFVPGAVPEHTKPYVTSRNWWSNWGSGFASS